MLETIDASVDNKLPDGSSQISAIIDEIPGKQ